MTAHRHSPSLSAAASLLLSVCCLIPLSAHAAIITERNDVYDGAGCYTPPAYTFIGTPSVPGIDSCWIPYGTYTGGTGGTEYTRVTSNLMGVVASALGGLAERSLVSGYAFMLRPLGIPDKYAYWSDGGEFLESTTNRSFRIADQLNLPLMEVRHEDTNYTYTVYSGDSNCIEPLLLNAARSYGSRRLDALTGNAEPPISSEWSTAMPWSASDADSWRCVYPRYGLCTNDIHFLPDGGSASRVFPCPFNISSYIPFWGSDAETAYNDIVNACTNPLPVTIEDVLSYDTGWSDDDYAHWTNGTTRLDWKRLGIVCQLERQMETTYESFDNTDELPLWHMDTSHEVDYYSSPVVIPLPEAEYSGQEMAPTGGLFQSASWTRNGEEFHQSTNIINWSTPTCRTPAPSVSGGAQFPPRPDPPGGGVQLDKEKAEEIISYLAQALEGTTNGVTFSHVSFIGNWEESGLLGMGLDYRCYSSLGEGTVNMPSNSVEVSASGGFHDTAWRDYPIAQDNWSFGDGNETLVFDTSELSAGSVNIDFVDSSNNLSLRYNEYSGSHDAENDSVTVPQITFAATGGGPVTNWMWSLSGAPGLPDVSKCRRSIGQDAVTWSWEGHPYIYVTAYGNGSTYDHYMFDFQENLDDGEYQLYVRKEGYDGLPSSWTSPSVSVTWQSATYQEKVYVTSGDTFLWQGVSVVYPATNLTLDAIATIGKDASATFTHASDESRDETISRFSPSYSSLDWSRIYSLRRSELELLISASGDGSQASDTAPSLSGDFTWNRIKDLSHSERVFRFLTGTSMRSLEMANTARYNLLTGLNDACRTECAEQGGMPIDVIQSVGKVTDQEEAAFLSALRTATVSGTFGIAGNTDFRIEANVHKSGGVYEVDNITVPSELPTQIGSCGWNLRLDFNSSSYNIYNAARADGYPAPVRKTLWKFKNLRDPNL